MVNFQFYIINLYENCFIHSVIFFKNKYFYNSLIQMIKSGCLKFKKNNLNFFDSAF